MRTRSQSREQRPPPPEGPPVVHRLSYRIPISGRSYRRANADTRNMAQLPPSTTEGDANSSLMELLSLNSRNCLHLGMHFCERATTSCPVFIAKELDVEELRSRKVCKVPQAKLSLGKLSDIQGTSTRNFVPKIIMGRRDYAPAVLWLARYIVYQEGRMTVVVNKNYEENSGSPTRLVTGWRVCIDYSHVSTMYVGIFHDMLRRRWSLLWTDSRSLGNSFQNCLSRLDHIVQSLANFIGCGGSGGGEEGLSMGELRLQGKGFELGLVKNRRTDEDVSVRTSVDHSTDASHSMIPEVDIIKKTENQAKMTKLSMEWKRLCKIKAKVQKCQSQSQYRRISSQTGAGTEEYYWMQS
ncbi:hypothetical protein Tco_0874008 [Tanacetum coccineum]|uniref:Uncharacterized protein n=1 Tax=Tanacetum coccineum TaxID=301880 RepID=A0ABQ5BN91_9ASTR